MADATEILTPDQLRAEIQGAKKKAPSHKYGAQRTQLDGINFPSKLEARYYRLLTQWYDSGAIVGFLRQIPFDIGGGRVHRVDFQIYHLDGTCPFVEVKGRETTKWRLKRDLVESRHPWIGTIRVVRKADVQKLEAMQ